MMQLVVSSSSFEGLEFMNDGVLYNICLDHNSGSKPISPGEGLRNCTGHGPYGVNSQR